jgi:DNA-binding winged helix-turn-helix (wHTH) protein
MPAIIGYEFDGFRIDTVKGNLNLNGELRPLRPTPFRLLVVLVENRGAVLTKEDLFKKVWANTVVTDANLDVALTAVRKALGESARVPKNIIKDRDGYRFVAKVREVTDSAIEPIEERVESSAAQPVGNSGSALPEISAVAGDGKVLAFSGRWHIAVSSALYGVLFSVALLLEVAYQWNRMGRTALRLILPVFIWGTLTSVIGLKLDQRLTSQGKSTGLLFSVLCFLVGAAILLAGLSFFLPAVPITESSLQTYPAQAAYLKDAFYFLLLSFFFLLLPFHFIVTAKHQVALGREKEILGLLTGNKLSLAPGGTVYPKLWALALLLCAFAAISIAMTSNLLDHLSPSPYRNLFTQLVYVRALIYFTLGIECLIWYYGALEDLKRQSLRLIPEPG